MGRSRCHRLVADKELVDAESWALVRVVKSVIEAALPEDEDGLGELLGDFDVDWLPDGLRSPSNLGVSSMKTVVPRGPGHWRPRRLHCPHVGSLSSVGVIRQAVQGRIGTRITAFDSTFSNEKQLADKSRRSARIRLTDRFDNLYYVWCSGALQSLGLDRSTHHASDIMSRLVNRWCRVIDRIEGSSSKL